MTTFAPSIGADRRADMIRQLASEGGYEMRTVGDSMVPTLQPGERIRVSSDRLPVPGEIGLFVSDSGALVVHRLVASTAKRWWFLGDNRVALDDAVPADQVVGRVTHILGGSTERPTERSEGWSRVGLLGRAALHPARVIRSERWRARHASC